MALTRTEAVALGIAAAGHLVLFGVLSIGFLKPPVDDQYKMTPIEVSISDTVALDTAAPELSSEAEAARKSPVEAPVEPDSAPPEPQPEPQPAVQPQPAPAQPAPPAPAPKPAPPKPKPAPQPAAKPKPSPPKPAPQPAAKPKPSPPKPAPAPAAKAKPSAPAKPAASAKPARPAPAAASSSRRPPTRNVRPTGNLDGLDLGRTNDRTNSQSTKPPAATMSAQASANIGSAIQRQVQPCADRQVNPGPGADKIRVSVNLRFNRDGSLAAPPRIIGHDGVDDSNERYVTRVDDAVRAIFAGCLPMRGLPDELYDVPRGWKSFTLRYRLKT